MKYERHINALAQEIGVPVFVDGRTVFDRHYNAHTRTVHIDPPVTQEAYFGALHELGHAANAHPTGRHSYGFVVNAEGEAWNWALDNALEVPSAATSRTIQAAIHSYLEGLSFWDAVPSATERALKRAQTYEQGPWITEGAGDRPRFREAV